MLRLYSLQQWCGLSDKALENAICDSQALRDFVGIDLWRESVPDATTALLKFRRLLLAKELTKALFDEINAYLAEQGLLMRAGTIVEATIIAAPSSTKHRGNVRDPDMHQKKNGNQWHFGMKAHIGVDAKRGGRPGTLRCSLASESNSTPNASGLGCWRGQRSSRPACGPKLSTRSM